MPSWKLIYIAGKNAFILLAVLVSTMKFWVNVVDRNSERNYYWWWKEKATGIQWCWKRNVNKNFRIVYEGFNENAMLKDIHWGRNKAHVLFVYYRYRQCLFHSCTSGLFWWRMMLQIRIRKLIMLATIIMKDIRMVTRICKMFSRWATDTDWN